MEIYEFSLIALPLWILVIVLEVVVVYYATREEHARQKLEKLARKQEQTFVEQSKKLDELLLNKSINETTYNRLKQLLQTDFEKKHKKSSK